MNTSDTFLWKELKDIPAIPQHLYDEAMDIALNEEQAIPQTGELYKELSPKIWFREIKDIDGRTVRGRPNIKFPLSAEFNEWIKENVCETHDGSFVNVAYQNKEGDGTTAPIHTDMSRDWVLIYLLEKSNEDQYTMFWKQNDKPTIRDRSTFLNDWDDCEKIGEVCFDTGKWYLMNARVLHSIHNILGDRRGRLAIQVKVDGDPLVEGFFRSE
jgi:hypothetical protein